MSTYKLLIKVLVSVFLLAILTRESSAENTDFTILESSTANVACYSRDDRASNLLTIFRTTPFVKNNFIYFTPETEFFYYWAKVNHGSTFSILFVVKIILPDGGVMYNNALALSMPSSDTDKPIMISAKIPLRDQIKSKGVTPDSYGKWSIEIYLKGELLDKKYFYVDNEDRLIESAEKNNEKTEVVKYYNDLKAYKETQHVILEKDGKVKFIYLGFTKERILEDIGQPFKIETVGESGKTFDKLFYLTNISVHPRPGGWVSRLSSAILDGDVSIIVTDKKDAAFGGGVIFHIEDGKLVRIRFP